MGDIKKEEAEFWLELQDYVDTKFGKAAPIDRITELEARLEMSDVCLQYVSVTLGGTDEWTDQESMVIDIRQTADETAARITELEAENARLREALKPFAEVAKHDIALSEHSDDIFRPMFEHNHAPILRIGHFRDAVATLNKETEGSA